MKKASMSLLEGKNLSGISISARLFEPRTVLMRIIDLWGSGPYYLNQAASLKDPIERIKCIVAFALSGESITQDFT